MPRACTTAATVAATLLCVPPAAGAPSDFAQAAIRQLCAGAIDLGTFGGRPSPGTGADAFPSYNGSGPSPISTYPGFPQAAPAGEVPARLPLRKPGWTVFAFEGFLRTADTDVFVLHGSCRRGTM